MDEAELPLDFALTDEERALLTAPTLPELVRSWQHVARAGLEVLSSGEGPEARERLIHALAAGASLQRATIPREVAAAAALICAQVASSREEDDWHAWACDLACWAWVAA
ncbi:MAG: hypothetical protein MUF64_31410 [Polyangiaceae bacterium]|jgi:hypothetical protein|nr:hypothetical protein [Polyangiaceae bacterium]